MSLEVGFRRRLGIASVVLVSGIGVFANGTQASGEAVVDVIVTFVDGANAAQEVAQIDPVEVKDVFDEVVNAAAVTVTTSELAELESNPNVEVVEPDHPVTVSSASWGLDRIDQISLPLSGSFSAPGTGSGVIVYVMDTGVRATHTDFGGRVASGYSTYAGTSATSDCDGHGTHVAGTIGGATFGVARGVTIVPVRVFSSLCTAWSSDIVDGLTWIRNFHNSLNPPRPGIVNISLGGLATVAVNNAVQTTVNAGISVVVAAGNDNADACTQSPASALSAITVGATNSSDGRWVASGSDGSNWGSCVDLYAPGAGITSAWNSSNTDSAVLTGTSMASPHVAGALAVMSQGTSSSRSFETNLLTAASSGLVSNNVSGTPNLLLYLSPSLVLSQAPEPMSILSDSLRTGLRRTPYDETLEADGSVPPYTWSVASGRLPKGLFLSPSGVISGTPSSIGSSTFSVRATSSIGETSVRQMTLQVAPQLEIRSNRLPNARVNVPVVATLASRGGVGATTWTVSGLPAGLDWSPSGSISGTVTVPGTYYVAVTVTDSAGNTVSRTLSLRVR